MAIITACAKHPEVETALRCSRCNIPICPRCLIQTPVGARCRECARIAKSPVYSLNGIQLMLAAVVSVGGGLVSGIVWALVLRPFSYGIFSIFLGALLGIVFTRALDLATRRKRGMVVFGFAVLGIVIAWSLQLLFVPWRVALYGLVAVGVAVYYAYQSLR